MFFFTLKHVNILLHQIMIFKIASYDPFKSVCVWKYSDVTAFVIFKMFIILKIIIILQVTVIWLHMFSSVTVTDYICIYFVIKSHNSLTCN